MRHAEAGPAAGGADEERPLSAAGEETCGKLRRHVEAQGMAFDLILCSSARRAADTCRLVVNDDRARMEPALYLAGAETLLARLKQLDKSIGSVLIVGHNPGLQVFAALLLGTGGGRLPRRLKRDFSPGALATLTVDAASWRGLAPNGARLSAFVLPKDLS